MEMAHLWTEQARDELSAALPEWDETLQPEEMEAIGTAMQRTAIDSLLVLTSEEKRLNTEAVPVSERSDAALIFLLSDLVYGPNRWTDSYGLEVASGERMLWSSTESRRAIARRNIESAAAGCSACVS